ncbi:PhzF family phenazine biosynthesis protein [Vibrio hannami]|uniref:PhzF family phenazine biosynthesis protein n=1 Tax=Vibrio hannami TaxID=2717094 RepID=UPI00240EC484|nr:PhzF family phenazine biosynthesis protein [Vibrio hannami]MDG3087747.1 PhzF family phenazine biosynthesis protein [Vibrio hannami]
MKTINVELINAFTANGNGGNPAGVVLGAEGLSEKQKLMIAQAVGYSETAFVTADDSADFAVSFYTVTDEVDFCGHATLATFSTLFKQGIVPAGQFTQRTKAGLLEVHIEPDGQVMLQQNTPTWLKTFSKADVSSLFDNLEPGELPIESLTTGLSDLILPVAKGTLEQLSPNDDAIAEFSRKHNLVGIHAFEICSEKSKYTANCRNFAPLFGIPEESATGSSNGALACYLTKHLGPKDEFLFEQGKAMNCRSELKAVVKYRNDKFHSVVVGGYAAPIGTKQVVV